MDILIFDMDGVLIDVSDSYRKTIQRTIQIYLKTCLGFERNRGDWVRDEEISLFKLTGGGLRGIRRILGTSWDGWVYRSGDIDKENLIKRIFQEVYLGKKFGSYYHLPLLFYRGKGFHLRERTLIPKKILIALRKKIRMGIASGRPRFEAELALKRFRLLPYFKSVATLDECEEEENRIHRLTGRKIKRSKPHPYSIIRTVQEIGLPHPICGYVGGEGVAMAACKATK